MTQSALDAKIDDWKEQLIDLTRRNSMVDFSATRSKTLPVEEPGWETIAAQLAAGREVYVRKPPEDATSDGATDESGGQGIGGEDRKAEGKDGGTDEKSGADIEDGGTNGEGDGVNVEDGEDEGEADDDREETDDTDEMDDGAASDRADEENGTEYPDTVLRSTRGRERTADSLYNITLNQRKHVQEKGVDALYVSLGMLVWQSVDYSDHTLRSPLFLASVSMTRETVADPERHDYVLTHDEEVILNPALRKKLRDEFGIDLPEDESFDIDTLGEAAAEIERLIAGRSEWHVEDTSIIGVFDFAKLGLFTDLEANREAITANPVVRALNGDPTDLNANAGPVPDADDLDEEVPPVDTYQVLEADSSQQEAIEAAKAGMSFVLQGPPGTGKSQTIANIIAEKLAEGERVLFVSEKEAALNVVKNRLDDVGLGRFCLEAHGRKANKDRLLAGLETELNAPSIKSPGTRAQELQRLRERRADLNHYGGVLTATFGAIEARPYDVFGEVSRRQEVPSVSWSVPDPLDVDTATLEAATDVLQRLESQAATLAEYDTHPWRATTLTEWRVDTARRMETTLERQQACLEDLQAFADRLAASLGIESDAVADLPAIVDTLDLLEDRPEIAWEERYFETAFYEERERLADLAAIEERVATAERELEDTYEESVYEADAREIRDDLAEYGLLRYVQPSYGRLKRRLLSHADETYDPGIEGLRADADHLAERELAIEDRAAYDDLADQVGPLYDAAGTDWERVHEVREWVQSVEESDAVALDAVRERAVAGELETESLLADARSLREEWDSASAFFREAMDVEATTIGEAAVDETPIYEASLSATAAELDRLAGAVDRLQAFLHLEGTLDRASEELCGSYVDRFLDASIDPEHLTAGFEREFYTDWLNAVYDRTDLGEFNAATVEQTLEEFRRLDERQQELAKVEVQHQVTSRRPDIDLQHATSSQQVLLRREIEKERRRKPLRVLFEEAGEMITRLQPCFMMSPLAVAQYLRTDSIDFDTVIFDEASQIMPQDAISSIIRADQVIVAGDTKQLPPTKFFSADTESSEDVREDLESILDEAATALPEKRLRWHYRSRSEDLIEFSNRQYYAGRLNTFPENDPGVETGVEFVKCEEGVYDRGGSRQNMPEARLVVNRIEEHAERHPEKTLGVVAFSAAQERAIRDVIEERRDENPTLDGFIDEEDSLEGFFVKNLEAVQGDERDVMLFSVGYGPDQSGKFTANFGPLNNSGGERRLNVAVTRAKERVVVVASFDPDRIDTSSSNARGLADLKKYLKYARGDPHVLDRDDTVSGDRLYDSAFEVAVDEALQARGYDTETQIDSSGYSIDLAVRHPETPGRFVLGIECDGAAYHSSRTARDRDRTRQLILEDLGWEIHRIWSPDWTSNRERELDRIDERVEALLDGDAERSSVAVDVEPEEPEEGAETDGGSATFTTYSPPTPRSGSRSDRDFHDASESRLEVELRHVVGEHGPIQREHAYRTVIETWGVTRLGTRIRERLDGVTDRLARSGAIRSHADALYAPSMTRIPVRLGDGDATRSVEQVPVVELAKIAHVILENGLEIEREDIVLEAARRFGWQRTGTKIAERIDRAVELLVRVGAVERADDGRLRTTDVDVDDLLLARLEAE